MKLSDSPLLSILLPTFAALLCLSLAGTAVAEEPCPIPFSFYQLDAAEPSGAKGDDLQTRLKSPVSFIGATYQSDAGGVVVESVEQGSSAEKAGLKAKDEIVAWNDEPAYSADEVAAILRQAEIGSTVNLQVVRDGKVLRLKVPVGFPDPVLRGLVGYAGSQECVEVTQKTMSEQQQNIAESAIVEDGALSCDSAHDRLAMAAGTTVHFQPGDLVFARTEDQILLSNAGLATACVPVADYDGDKLSPLALEKLFERVAADYLANPSQ